MLDIHFIQEWSLDESNFNLTLHVKVSSNLLMKELDILRKKMKFNLRDKHIQFTTIQFEGDDCEL